jgi:uncharacterized phage protein (TIGR02220 family)
MRSYIIPESFFKALPTMPKLYSRVWFFWLSSYADEILEPCFAEQLEEIMPKSKVYTIEEIKEIYKYGVELLREGNFEILDTEQPKKKKRDNINKEEQLLAEKIIEYLNGKIGATFSTKMNSNFTLIVSLLRAGYTYSDFVKVIDTKTEEWLNSDMSKYLRPVTLFNKTKFDTYLNGVNNGSTKAPTKFDNLLQAINEAKRDNVLS